MPDIYVYRQGLGRPLHIMMDLDEAVLRSVHWTRMQSVCGQRGWDKYIPVEEYKKRKRRRNKFSRKFCKNCLREVSNALQGKR